MGRIMMWKANPNSFRQAILEQFEKGKTIQEVLDYFKARGNGREPYVYMAYRDYIMGERSIRNNLKLRDDRMVKEVDVE
jgi:hypothetical protein